MYAAAWRYLVRSPIHEIRLIETPNQFYDVRSGPISSHDSALEQVQKEASAEPSSSNLDVTASQDLDITSSTLSNQDSLKRKIPDDGFDEENVRIFFFCYFVPSNLIINRRNLDIQMLVIGGQVITNTKLTVDAEPYDHIS